MTRFCTNSTIPTTHFSSRICTKSGHLEEDADGVQGHLEFGADADENTGNLSERKTFFIAEGQRRLLFMPYWFNAALPFENGLHDGAFTPEGEGVVEAVVVDVPLLTE